MEDQIMILTKLLEDRIPTIGNAERSTKDSLGSKEPAEEAGRINELKLGGEHVMTCILTVIDFRSDRLTAVA
jgi:hypothetical protein